jgi:magnesium-transporting ATPase (P-type)
MSDDREEEEEFMGTRTYIDKNYIDRRINQLIKENETSKGCKASLLYAVYFFFIIIITIITISISTDIQNVRKNIAMIINNSNNFNLEIINALEILHSIKIESVQIPLLSIEPVDSFGIFWTIAVLTFISTILLQCIFLFIC